VLLLAAAAAVGVLVGAASLAKDIRLVVDGEAVAVRSFAGSVHELLSDAGVTVGFGDYLSLGAQQDLADGTTVVVKRARPVRLTVDGRTSNRVVTATNVGDALDELEIGGVTGRLSAELGEAVPLSGMSLTVYTERRVLIVAEGRRRWARTTAGTVRQVLAQERIRAPRGYRVTPELSSFPRQGAVIRVEPERAVPVAPEVAGLDWAALAACESRGDSRAYNAAGPYYGLYQFSLDSWRAVGGSGVPTAWPPEEQTYRAQLLYQRVQGRWQGQWPHCGGRLFGR
jgi:resuscitation-promoting factor RpfB